ncbi:MAG: type II toxin-antitoxin system HigB family toxin [Desulfuromusa sp.]
MHVVRKRPFDEAAKKYPKNRIVIMDTYRALKAGRFDSPEELKKEFPTLDNFKYKDKWYVIDIGGNNLRIMAMVLFKNQKFYVKHIVTHAEYDKLCKRYRKGAQ